MLHRWITFLLILCAGCLSGCDETDLVAIRIHLKDDLTGTVATSALAQPTVEGALQVESQGATWESRVDVACAAGRFESLSGLKLADLVFHAGEAGDGLCFVKLVLPRGEQARWPRALVPLSSEERGKASSAIDPSGGTKNVGSVIKVAIELPKSVVSSGLTGKTRGTKATYEGAVATLVVPLDTAQSEGESIVWHLTWQK